MVAKGTHWLPDQNEAGVGVGGCPFFNGEELVSFFLLSLLFELPRAGAGMAWNWLCGGGGVIKAAGYQGAGEDPPQLGREKIV